MKDERDEIHFLIITAATAEYAKRYGAKFNGENGWHIVGEVPLELEEFVIESPRKRNTPIKVKCPICGSQMQIKESRTGNLFWGCMTFPRCRGTRRLDEVDEEGGAKRLVDIAKQNIEDKRKDNDVEKAKVFAMALKVLGGEKNAERWFSTPKVGLNGKRPVDLWGTPEGRKLLVTMLESIDG